MRGRRLSSRFDDAPPDRGGYHAWIGLFGNVDLRHFPAVTRSRRPQECPQATRNDTAQGASAGSFLVGAAMPLLVTAMAPTAALIPLVSGTSLVVLACLGGLAARVGGAGMTMGAIRVTSCGALAMALTAGVGVLFRTVA